MSEVVISLKNISKCFKRYHRPVDRLKELLFPGKSRAELFWALQNIDLEVLRGQTVGVVGRNGSGKSTLLQIIAGTLTATSGTVQVNGRVSALLELGSGFNPEFTGRQNVFFNGRLLGLTRQEIEAKFDDIAKFADIGSFIDQPVKTYSSGMFVRLAFAVAINVEPDILVVDEALAVGDEAFQRQCFGKLRAIQERGGTIFFVSHAAPLVVELCNHAILLNQGNLILSGSPKEVVSQYQRLIYAPLHRQQAICNELLSAKRNGKVSSLKGKVNQNGKTRSTTLTLEENNGTQETIDYSQDFYDPTLIPKTTSNYESNGAKIENPHLTTLQNRKVNVIRRGQTYIYKYQVKFSKQVYNVRFGMMLKTLTGLELGGAVSHDLDHAIDVVYPDQVIQVAFKFRSSLQPNVYFLNAGVTGSIGEGETFLDRCLDAAMFRIQPEDSLLETGIVDFQVEQNITQLNQFIEV
ncbi:ABC transporter ATP-binding protein [Spirulina sp. CS-785/01]|uniref:ABC transporter ATP-binding protein n=1 Tax=Spirulina sp. CS-785/01 TaxID=3021716 RepID=UPI00232D5CA4|nr:ABC transporter ATP-binding protein [Spirulina sp. CS-785/01]MDB9313047.1 ABC transporter ATP-binding protein [Spirulina sp. CS-785/01]